MLVFKDFMSEENFVKWYCDHPQYKFDKGQEPMLEDFSSKEVYERVMEALKAVENIEPQPSGYKPGRGN